jgi:DNA invertase Pin-like site-specific DNA recombinase
MARRAGSADLPLHGGYVPKWLACFLDMLGVFAEFETNLRRERQLEGIAKAKAAGVYKGRPPSIEPSRVRELKAQGMRAGRHRQSAQDWPGFGLSGARVGRSLSRSRRHR